MKKHVLLFSLVIFVLQFSYGQTQRRVLVEEATNASCGPCASQNPAFDALLQQNTDKVAVIKYHASWPGYDPMYNHNTGQNSYRITYYGINGVPTGVMDGTYSNSPAYFTQGLIDQHYAEPAPFAMDIYHYLSADQDSMYVVARIRAAQDITEDNLRAYVVVVEKHIHFNSSPGSNGETDFYDVMKTILPTKSGTGIMEEWQDGDYQMLLYGWELQNVYDIDQLGVVGFIQDNDDKDVKQAALSSDTPFNALFAEDVAALEISNLTETNCSGTYTPEVTIANFGSDILTSLDIVYDVNGENQMTYNWTGNLASLKTEKVLLPAIDFTVLDQNELTISLQHPNESTDEYTANNDIAYIFNAAITTPNETHLMIKTDDHPEDLTWTVKNSNGEVVFEGGPYSDPNTVIIEDMVYSESDCYLFTLNDSRGDGIQAPGFFALYYGSGTQIVSGTDFGSRIKGQYSVDATVSVPEEAMDRADVEIYPNPVNDRGTIMINLPKDEQLSVNLLNSLGQQVSTVFSGKLSRGSHQIALDLTDRSSGIYFVKFSGGTTNAIFKVFKQ